MSSDANRGQDDPPSSSEAGSHASFRDATQPSEPQHSAASDSLDLDAIFANAEAATDLPRPRVTEPYATAATNDWKTFGASEQQDFLEWLEGESISSTGAAAQIQSGTVSSSSSIRLSQGAANSSIRSSFPADGLDGQKETQTEVKDTSFQHSGESIVPQKHSTGHSLAPSPEASVGPPALPPGSLSPEDCEERLKCYLDSEQNVNPLQVRALCEQCQCLSEGLRTKIWSYLLPCHDLIATVFKRNQKDGGPPLSPSTSKQYLDQERISRDAAAVAQALNPLGERQQQRNVHGEIEAALLFLCRHLGVTYHPIMGPLYATLAIIGWKPAETFGRFYTLCNWMLPNLLLPSTTREGFVREVHSEFRCLLTYHAPLVAQHLDRNCPGWEKPPLTHASPARAEQEKRDAESCNIVDALEERLATSRPTVGADGLTNSPRRQPPVGSTTAEVERNKHPEGSGGFIPSSWLLGLFAEKWSSGKLLSLWTLIFLRGDRYMGLFLCIALLLRQKRVLLSLQGPALRQKLTDLCEADDLPWADSEAAPTFASKQLSSICKGNVSKSTEDLIRLWVEDADRLERSTPISFRAHLTELEYAAKGLSGEEGDPGTGLLEYERWNSTRYGLYASSSSELASYLQTYTTQLARLTHPCQVAIEELQAGKRAESLPGWSTISPTRKRGLSSQRPADRELSFPVNKLCLHVAPEETVPQWCSTERPRSRTTNLTDSLSNYGSNQDPLMSKLRFFGLDCRPREHLAAGRFPIGYHFEPSRVEDPEEIQRLMVTLEPVKKIMHITLIGTGDRSSFVSSFGSGQSEKANAFRMREQLQRAAREDVMHLNNCALLLIKRGFPHVSILDGGYVAAHNYLNYQNLLRFSDGNSRRPSTQQGQGPGLGALIDHVSANCRMCKHEALLRFHRGQAGAESKNQSWNVTPQPPRNRRDRASSPGTLAGPLDFSAIRNRASGLLGKVGGSFSGTATPGSAPARRGSDTAIKDKEARIPPASLDVKEVGEILKGKVAFWTRKAEQAISARAGDRQFFPSSGGGMGSSPGRSGQDSAVVGGMQISPLPNKPTARRIGPQPLSTSPPLPRHSSATLEQATAPKTDSRPGSLFVIQGDDDDDEEVQDDHFLPSLSSPLSVESTDNELQAVARRRHVSRDMALQHHRINGLQTGQDVSILPEAWPEARLYVVHRLKRQLLEVERPGEKSTGVTELPRYIALTPERLLEIETAESTKLAGEQGRVESNHHLTELVRMTFMRKAPEIISLYFRVGCGEINPGSSSELTVEKGEQVKKHSYRTASSDEFIADLQQKLQRFK